MEFFENAKTVRLKSHHGKYLWAEDDQCVVTQDRDNKHAMGVWRVEHHQGSSVINLKSCFDTYLTASDSPYLLGMTGKKVVQSRPATKDASKNWEPVSEGFVVKLKSFEGNYLRANGGMPPWRNSVTHDVPHKSHHPDWILWEVEIVEKNAVIAKPVEVSAPRLGSPPRSSPPRKQDGRQIYFTVADDDGQSKGLDEGGWPSFVFKGHSLKLLKQRLQDEAGIDEDILVCARHPLSTKLYPLRLELPPNTAPMYIAVVKSSSPFAKTFSESQHTPPTSMRRP